MDVAGRIGLILGARVAVAGVTSKTGHLTP